MPTVDTSDITTFLKDLDRTIVYSEDEIDGLEGLSDVDMANNGSTANILIHQYEQVVVRSLITSFGLDKILFADMIGGDVDMILNVRNKDRGFADKANEEAYNNRGKYDKQKSKDVHADKRYTELSKKNKEAKKAGNLEDAYRGKKFKPNDKTNLDHVISAKEIHDDPARILAGRSTEEAANIPDNLIEIDAIVNASKNDDSASDFLARINANKEKRKTRIQVLKEKGTLTDKEKNELHKLERLDEVDGDKLMAKDKAAREAYDLELARAYYTSPKFLKAATVDVMKKGFKMGLREALGIVLTEVWCAIREDFSKIIASMKEFDLEKFLRRIAKSFKKAFQRAADKFKTLIASFAKGALAGALSSISNTIMNMFFVTAKNVARILRESWSSLLDASRILFLNPDNLSWGERIRAATKVIAVAVSVILGGIIQECVSKLNIGIPELGDVLSIFLGVLVTGVLSITLVYFLDNSEIVNKLVKFLDDITKSDLERTVESFKQVNKKLDMYLAELTKINYSTFSREIIVFRVINDRLCMARNDRELNSVLRAVVKERGISMPYDDLKGLDDFMLDEDAVLVV